tara:strand:+ start:862 stop:1746 length:885 start_codon:yes stop_codon:yes gene_type:complete
MYSYRGMKKIFLAFAFYMITSLAYADDLTANVSKKISEFASNLIPGEGHTEASIQLRQNASPDFSILGVREILPMDDGKIFTQFSLMNTEVNSGNGGDERLIGNLGLGARKLSDNNRLMFGINNFYDYDIENEHLRTSLGIEARSAVLDFKVNRYYGLSDEYNEEQVLDGWDYELATQIPYLHWAKAFATGYEWEGVLREDVRGTKYGSEMQITPNLNFELAYDDKKKVGMEDEWYSKIQFVHPGKEGPTALDGVSNTAWKENRDMSGELLSKVKRSNKIMIEFKGSSSISRTD